MTDSILIDKIDNKEYWNNFYKHNEHLKQPSSFAKYISEKYISDKQNKTFLELGCGNGRDSLFFASQGLSVIGLDLSIVAIENLKKNNFENVNFQVKNFCELENFKNIDFVYSRFAFHSIDENAENAVIDQLKDVISPEGFFFLEARTSKDEALPKEFGIEHYRRYLNFEKTIIKIKKQGFEILESIESQGLSPYKKEDPYLLRIIAKLK